MRRGETLQHDVSLDAFSRKNKRLLPVRLTIPASCDLLDPASLRTEQHALCEGAACAVSGACRPGGDGEDAAAVLIGPPESP